MIELGNRGGARTKTMQSAQPCPEEQRSLTREFGLLLDEAEDVSRNLLRAQSAASRVPPKILTYVQVCSGFRLPPLLAAWAPRDDFWTHLECDSLKSGNAASAICYRSVTCAEAVARHTTESIMGRLHCVEGVDGQD
jgi:hypothetical protein